MPEKTGDITGHKPAEVELMICEENLRYASMAADIGTWHLDLVKNELIWDEKCRKHFGAPADQQMTYEKFLLTIHEEDRQRTDNAIRKALQDRTECVVEMRVALPDGAVRWVCSKGRGFYDAQGKPICMHGITMDISRRKNAEEMVQKSELKFAAVFNAAPILLSVSKPAGGEILFVNDTLLTTCGYQREEVVGRTAKELCIWENPADRERVVEKLLEQRSVRDLEINFKGKDGKLIVGLMSAELVEIDSEEYMLSLVKDITERKRAEAEIEKLNAALLERAAELEESNQELAAFNHTVSHDLRQPLNNIHSACQAISLVCGDALEKECREYLDVAFKGVQRMDRLITDLLRLSQSAHSELQLEMVDLTEIARAVAAGKRLDEPARQARFEIAEELSSNGDPALLRVVLENLIGNAWKFTRQQAEAVIEFGAMEIEGNQAFFVRDNGTGFDAADAEALFLPFKRLAGTETFKGHGIGLATVERIIRRHGGKVWAEGEPGKGATFFFTLEAS